MNPVRVPERQVEPTPSVGPDPTVQSDGRNNAPGDAEETLPRLTGAAELFHQLNNQLGIILANAELLELKARDDTGRARASQVVTSVLEALQTARTLRRHLDP
jgi:hypothetical protein